MTYILQNRIYQSSFVFLQERRESYSCCAQKKYKILSSALAIWVQIKILLGMQAQHWHLKCLEATKPAEIPQIHGINCNSLLTAARTSPTNRTCYIFSLTPCSLASLSVEISILRLFGSNQMGLAKICRRSQINQNRSPTSTGNHSEFHTVQMQFMHYKYVWH